MDCVSQGWRHMPATSAHVTVHMQFTQNHQPLWGRSVQTASVTKAGEIRAMERRVLYREPGGLSHHPLCLQIPSPNCRFH